MKGTVSTLSMLILSTVLSAQTFMDVAPANNFVHQFYGTEYGTGVSFYDVNGDGWDDVTIGQAGEPISLYLNNEGDLSLPISIGSDNVNPKGLSWCDYDNDGDADLMVTNYNGTNHLYQNNGDLNFMVDVTQDSGILHSTCHLSYGISWSDTDRDGDLDLYICNYNSDGVTNEFYVNNGDGTFAEASAVTGIDNGSLWSFQGLFMDYDHDLWPDLHVINDRLPASNHFYKNQNGVFEDVTTEIGLEMYIFSMNNSMADFDRDGDMDLYISNNPFGNHLMQFNDDGIFEHASDETGTNVFDHSWSALWIDYDNNGWEDLHVNCSPFWGEPGQNRFFINNQLGSFTEDAVSVGLGSDDGATHSSAIGDLNNDGFPDFLCIANAPDFSRIYQNTGNDNSYLVIDLKGTISNFEGIGSWIEVFTNGESQIRYTQSGEGYLTQNSSKEFFGLGQFDQADSIHIEWPSGHLDVLYDVSGNQTLVIQEGNSISGNILYQGLHICDGDSILLIAEDGLNPVWNGSIETDSLWVSEVGNYSYMATTEYGIPFTSELVTVNLGALAASLTEIIDPSCAGEENGSISVEVDDDATIYIDDLLYTEPLDNLPAGEYTVTVTQAGFCSSIESVTLVDPDTLSLEIIVTHPLCYDNYGSAEVEVSGGTEPYEISWGIIDPMELEEGIHSCEIIDGNDCLAQANCEIIAPEEIDTDIITTPADEGDNGVIVLEIEGGQEPYVVNWNGPNGYSGSGEMIEDLEPGIYTATIVDNNGCLEILIIDLDGMNTVEFALSNIAISPNPFQDVIIVSNLTGNETEIAVISHQGQLVKQFPISNNDSAIKLDLSSVAKGLYILQIKANNQLISYKIIHS